MMLFWIVFSIHSIIEFLSKTASFRRIMKWTQKALCVAITDLPVLKKTFQQQTHFVH